MKNSRYADLPVALLHALEDKPDQHWLELRASLHRRNREAFGALSRKEINSSLAALHRARKIEYRAVMSYGRKRWYPSSLTAQGAQNRRQSLEAKEQKDKHDWPLSRSTGRIRPRPVLDPSVVAPTELHRWQQRAFAQWQRMNRRGVIEAATGAGKTRLASLAIAEELRAKGAVLVVVPTRLLADQWRKRIEDDLELAAESERLVECKASKRSLVLAAGQVCVAVVNSARDVHFRLPANGGLLVADEVHWCAARAHSRALQQGFGRRLGLTATLEREDGLHVKVLRPFFESLCYRFTLLDAIKARVVVRPKIATIGVEWASKSEEQRYKIAVKSYLRAKARLIGEYGAPHDSFSALAERAGIWTKDRSNPDRQRVADEFGKAFRRARLILSSTRSKLHAITVIARNTKPESRVLIFSETGKAAKGAADAYSSGARIPVRRVHRIDGKTPQGQRKEAIKLFEDEEDSVLVGPKVLDEGLDVRAAGLGIIVASARSRRQLLQRIGRVVRLAEGKRSARIVILYVVGTGEDPFARDRHVVGELLSEIRSEAGPPTRLRITDEDRLRRFLGTRA
ncbi:MAG: DEAD/DEAH box helicase [Gemmatimonadaceae bacterium]